MRYQVGVIGHFGNGKDLLNGQTIKTKIVTHELERVYGKNAVLKFDTHGGIKAMLKLPIQVFSALRKSERVIIFPAYKGVRIITPILLVQNLFFRRSLHYVVIGGWLAKFLKKRPFLKVCLQAFDGIYVETRTMKFAMENLGFQNIRIMKNCKELKILAPTELISHETPPYRFCTFSRVMKEKGIEDAIRAVDFVNRIFGETVYTLDIYGQIDANQTEWFDTVQKEFPPFVRYMGAVPYNESVDVLKDYFALLFPTRFYTEGIPGTIIDAYAAGVPVIASRWESFEDMVDDGVTGLGYEFSDTEAFFSLLAKLVDQPEIILEMKRNCIQKAAEFLPHTAVEVLTQK